jgi:hypothetical protein
MEKAFRDTLTIHQYLNLHSMASTDSLLPGAVLAGLDLELDLATIVYLVLADGCHIRQKIRIQPFLHDLAPQHP